MKSKSIKSFDGYLTEAFTRQHYVQIAKVLNHFYADDPVVVKDIANQLSSQVFRPDNPAFDHARFMEAVTKGK